METGANLFEKYTYPGYSKRMFVLSDGLANVGLRTKEEIMKAVKKYNEKGIIIDSFGIGEDFDAEIMKDIAEAGCGQFFFLESAEVIVTLMTKALRSAILGDLHVDNLRVVLCDFTVSGTVPEGTEVDILDYQLKYHCPGHIEEEPLTIT
ncbi:unnamed protein product, partial [Rotaria sordida]